MELKDYIEAGITRCGGVQQLADHLGVFRQQVTNAKGHQRGIPNDAAFKLAALLSVDVRGIIAASELATERKEAKREFWRPFAQSTELGRIASYALILNIVTNFLTTTSPKALYSLKEGLIQFVLCKVRNLFHAIRKICKSWPCLANIARIV